LIADTRILCINNIHQIRAGKHPVAAETLEESNDRHRRPGLAPGAVRTMLKVQAAIAVPASLPALGLCCAIGIAMIGIGWWKVLPGPLPGDEYYAAERAALYTLRTVLALPEPVDAPPTPRTTALGLGIAGLGIALALLGVALRGLRPRLHAWLLCRARNLVFLLPSRDSTDPMPADALNETVVVLGSDGPHPPGGPHLTVPLDEHFMSMLLPRCAARVRELMALGPDSAQNLDLSTRVVLARLTANVTEPLNRLRLRLDNRPLRIALSRDGLCELAAGAVDARLTSLPSARCRRLLRDQPPNKVRVVEKSGQPTLVVIGLDETGLELIARLCTQAQSPTLDPLHVVIVDGDAVAVERDLRELWSALDLVVSFVPLPFEARLPQSADHLLRALNRLQLVPTCIYLALEERVLCEAWSREFGLACRTAGDAAPLVLSVRFPRLGSVDPSLLVEEEALDAVPRGMHADYLQRQRTAGAVSGAALVDWEHLPYDLQEDNRSAADHFWTQSREIDLLIVANTVGIDALPQSVQLEPLAIAEHRRWLASRTMMGWLYGTTRSDSLRVHPSLQTWDSLTDSERDKDRAVVSDLPAALATIGYGLRPLVRRSLYRQPQQTPNRPADITALAAAALAVARQTDDAAVPNIIIGVDDGPSFILARVLAATPGISVSLVVTRSLEGLAIQANLPAGAGAELAEAAWDIWITAPPAVAGVLDRWPELKVPIPDAAC
jgi:hypothetical protein